MASTLVGYDVAALLAIKLHGNGCASSVRGAGDRWRAFDLPIKDLATRLHVDKMRS